MRNILIVAAVFLVGGCSGPAIVPKPSPGDTLPSRIRTEDRVISGTEIRDEWLFSISRFTVAPPLNGSYVPWISGDDRPRPYAGETISVGRGSFIWSYFTDVIEEGPPPRYVGKIIEQGDRIFLDHPEVAYPYRVSGVADGIPVLLRWRGYEDWKKTGRLFWEDILFFYDERAESELEKRRASNPVL